MKSQMQSIAEDIIVVVFHSNFSYAIAKFSHSVGFLEANGGKKETPNASAKKRLIRSM